VLRTVRYAEAGEISGEIHENVREGEAIFAGVRPLDPDVDLIVEGRRFGTETWTTLTAEVVDPVEGRIRIVNAADSPWPPVSASWSSWPWGRRQRQIWPLVRLGYANLAAPLDELEDLGLVVEVLAAHWDRESSGSSGVLVAQTAGIVSEQYSAGSSGALGTVPNAVGLILATYGGLGRARLSR